MTTPSDPIREFKLGVDRYPRREPVNSPAAGSAQLLDAETLDVVQRFEALYAELASPAPAQVQEILRVDDLLIDLPDDLRTQRALGSSTPARPAEAAQGLETAAPPAAAPAPIRDAEQDRALDIDEAFAMLRAAESQGRTNGARDAADDDEEEIVTAAVTAPDPLRPLQLASDRRPAPTGDPAPAGNEDWSGRSRAMWPKVIGAAVIALIVGTGAGYIVGQSPKTSDILAKIPITPQGGAQLQFDYELQKR